MPGHIYVTIIWPTKHDAITVFSNGFLLVTENLGNVIRVIRTIIFCSD